MSDTPESRPGEFLVGLPGWIIEDGNYEDFSLGERRRFALQFFDEGLREVSGGVSAAVPHGPGLYDVLGRVAYATKDVVMLNFGLLAFSENGPRGEQAGGWLAGLVSLSVDCFSYFEIYARRKGIPPAVYTWTITGIWQDTTIWMTKLDGMPDKRVRHPATVGYLPLDRTGAASGYANYLLRCRLEDVAATRRL